MNNRNNQQARQWWQGRSTKWHQILSYPSSLDLSSKHEPGSVALCAFESSIC